MVGGLFQWLSNFRLKDKGEEATHYCLVGGKFCIPEKDHAQWLAYYAEHLQVSSEPIYFVERRTPYFRMHYDLDMIQLDVPTLEDVIGMVRICNNVFRRFYPGQPEDNRFTAIILKSPTMDKTVCADGSTEQVAVQKTGFHIIWPLLLVNQVQALTMREACVVEMVRVLPPRVFPANPMEEVVDDCVLLENGLRMVGSDKAKQCDLCGGKGRVDGDNCMNCRYGRVPERRVYTPYCVLTAAGEPDEGKLRVLSREENKLPLVSCCSIRSAKTQPTPGYYKPPLVPEITPDMLLKEKKRHALQKTRAANGKAVVEGGIRWLGDATSLERDSVVFQQMQEFLQKRMGRPEWAQLQIKSFLYSSTSNRYLLKVWSDGSRWCGNVGREHSSSTIFFVVNKHGVVQKCFCKKRNYEPYCSSYASAAVKLTRTLHTVLFNEEGGESAPALPPAPLVSPIASTQPFVPTQPLPPRKRSMPDVTAQLSTLPVVAPVVHQKVQLQAQQAAQRLAQAMQHRLGSSSAAPAGTGKRGGGKKSMKPVSHACQPSGKLRARDMVKLDKERATQSSGMVEQMRAEMQQSQSSATRPAKKAKKA
jgi:hypothetical protein